MDPIAPHHLQVRKYNGAAIVHAQVYVLMVAGRLSRDDENRHPTEAMDEE
jgi:hypothetical protein